MDIATTSSVVVRREIKAGTLSVDALRALALTAVKNCVDPDGAASFGEQDATVNADGSITVTLAIETVQPDPAVTAPAPVPPLAPGLVIPVVPPPTV